MSLLVKSDHDRVAMENYMDTHRTNLFVMPAGLSTLLIVTLAVITAGIFAIPACADIGRSRTGSIGSFTGQSPQSLAVDQSNGDVYALDPDGGSLHRFTATGAPDDFTCAACSGNTITGLPLTSVTNNVSQVAVDRSGGPADGDIYVADGSGSAIRVFANDGTPLTTLTGSGTPATGFSFACGVAVDQTSGDVYVGDYVGQAVWRYSPSAATPSESDYSGGIATATTPCAVAAAQGKVYASDTLDRTDVERFSASDFSTGSPPSPTPIVIDHREPAALAADPLTGDLYVDGDNAVVGVYDSAGAVLYYFGPDPFNRNDQTHSSAGVAVQGPAGTAYTSDAGTVYAPETTSHQINVYASPAEVPGFGFTSFDGSVTNRDGSTATQAGSHPYEATTTFSLHRTFDPDGHEIPVDTAKDLSVELPPGLVGDPTAVPKCSQADFLQFNCPNDTAVGFGEIASTDGHGVGAQYENDPIYNLDPPPGVPAEFGFNYVVAPVRLDASLRTGGDYGVTIGSKNINAIQALVGGKITFWGAPGDHSHDPIRGHCLAKSGASLGDCSTNLPLKPLLTLPTSCTGPVATTVRADAYEHPGNFASRSFLSHDNDGNPIGGTGCDQLDFTPSITVQPDTSVADSPTGLHVDLHVPQAGLQDPTGLAAANLKKAVVTLPVGVSVNPAAADGLDACSRAQLDLSGSGPASCPDASKVGSVEIDTPLLDHPVKGGVFLAEQNDNPFNSLLGIYIAVNDPQSGVVVKLAGHVVADPATGQLATTFDNNPQLPFSDFKLDFFGGPRAALATPDSCGTFTTVTALSPWSGTAARTPGDSFAIDAGCAGGFAPGFSAGVTNPSSGHGTDFALQVARADGQQQIRSITTSLPVGLLARIASVSLCGDAQASAGSCDAGSQVGVTDAAAGAGSNPFHIAGKVYLTGPYKGAPYGLSIVVPAIAGPFNLGMVVVRAAIFVDPHDSHVTVVSDDVPNVLDAVGADGQTNGFPLRVRSIDVDINRPGFMVNPTGCDATTVGGSVGSWEGSTAQVSSRFQIGGCSALPFSPTFSASTSARTSRANGASLDAKIVIGVQGESNAHVVFVSLPKQLPSRLTTIQKACLAATFNANPAGCPEASLIGMATASTPLLPAALSGPAYLVSHGGAGFPDLVIVLQGNGVRFDLVGAINISSKGITSTRFANAPDVPINSFELRLPQGPHSILTSNGSLCAKPLVMPTTITAYNAKQVVQQTRIKVTGCPKAKKAKKSKRAKRHKAKAKTKRAGKHKQPRTK